MRSPVPSRRARRGNYAVLFVLAIPVILGFGALAVDTSFIRLTQSQCQDVADAAGQAALIALRRTGDTEIAREAAQQVVDLNVVGGSPPQLQEMVFGTWDADRTPSALVPNTRRPNAIRATVGRGGDLAVPLFLARIWGYESFEVARSSTSAARDLHVILVVDITNSWNPQNFRFAQQAAVRFFDLFEQARGPRDMIGMTVFTNRFGWEFTPLSLLNDEDRNDEIRESWVSLKTASKAGNGTNWPSYCTLNASPNQNNFNSPAGGCYPNMPREYRDEPGTDHTTGMGMAWQMFQENSDSGVFKVMVVLTDGQPNGILTAGTTRGAQGYTETRWREYLGPIPHSSAAVRTDSIAMTQAMWDEDRVHTYVISFVADDWFMYDMPQGQGYYVRTSSAAALVPIFEDIANDLPLAIVE